MVSYLKDTNAIEKYTGSAWVSIDTGSTSPLTTKGDLYTYSTTDARLAVGNNGETLVADSSTATGLKWAKDPVADLVTTAGDTLYATGADTLTRLGIGTAGQVLTVNSGATAPEWKTPASTAFVGCAVTRTSNQTISNNTATAIEWNSEEYDTDGFHDNVTNNSRLTIPSGKGGKYLISGAIIYDADADGARNLSIYKNGTIFNYTNIIPTSSSASYTCLAASMVMDLAAGDYIQIYTNHTAGNNLIIYGTDSRIQISKIG